MVIKKIGVMSAAKICGVMYAALGLIGSAVVLVLTAIGASAGVREAIPMVVGVVIAVLIPVFYGFVGFIGAALAAAIFNVVAKYVGGLEIETETYE